MRIPRWTLVSPLALALIASACGTDNRKDENPDVTASESEASGDTAVTDAGTSAADEGEGEETTGGPKLDTMPETATAEAGGDGCDKVDFLFVIDNSGSMDDEQQSLIASFPGFIEAIQNTVQGQDYHIMAVSTDNNQNTGLNSSCINGDCSCTPAPVCCQNACGFGGNTCLGFPCSNLPITQCDFEYGSGKQYDANGNNCMLADGRRYMTDAQPNLAGTFQCIANVGIYGSGEEKVMQSMVGAVSDPMNAPGGCDEGFLRDDAILVVVFITDEEDSADGGSTGEPAGWASALVAAKNGDPSAIVVLGIFGDSHIPGGICPPGADPGNGSPGAEPAPRLEAFTTMFDNGVVGSVCATPDQYVSFFLDAVEVIDNTCDEFVPPG